METNKIYSAETFNELNKDKKFYVVENNMTFKPIYTLSDCDGLGC
jgi:hypothetical protein